MIENYIPKGYRNRISRKTLEAMTHKSDRINRKEMEEALLERDVLIINIDNGYFVPDGSAEDMLKARAYYRREVTRTSSCSNRCKAIKRCLEPKKHDDLKDNQICLSSFGIG